MSNHGWIGVDLDGTLAHYTGWKGADHIGPPIPAMLERVKRWLAEGQEVRIFTARVYCGSREDWPTESMWRHRQTESSEARAAIKAWCIEHLGYPLPITCVKDFGMIELWDDRCIQVEKNTGIPQANVIAHKLYLFHTFIDSLLDPAEHLPLIEAIAKYREENP